MKFRKYSKKDLFDFANTITSTHRERLTGYDVGRCAKCGDKWPCASYALAVLVIELI